ncbi:unnamed protein product [Urochloa humidicola]
MYCFTPALEKAQHSVPKSSRWVEINNFLTWVILISLLHLCLFFSRDGTVPIMLKLGLLAAITAGLATLGRIGKRISYTASKVPPQPIEIWAYEV